MKKSLVLASLVLLGASQSMHGMKKTLHAKAWEAAQDGVTALFAVKAINNTSLGEKYFGSKSHSGKTEVGAFAVAALASYFIDTAKWKTKWFKMMRNSVTAFYGSNELAKIFTDKGNSKKIAWGAGITAVIGTWWCPEKCCEDEEND